MTFAEVQRLALALPEATEELTWGTDTTWRVRGKIFAIGGAESPGVTLKASISDQAALVAGRPETFAIAPYVGRYGWVNATLSTVDVSELGELLVEAWRRTAPKKLVREYDARA